jgi:Response regulator containing CheY-like receiver domain and AraC-type DNA-binding domain
MISVLIVDDENIVRVGLRSIINWEENGFKLAALFDNGKDAFDFCMENKPDILITDVKMPVMDGIDLIKKVKACLPDIKIIVLSNYDDFQYVSASFKMGINDYILKQFLEPEKLLEVLNGIKKDLNKKIIPTNNVKLDNYQVKDDFVKCLISSTGEADTDFYEAHVQSFLSVTTPGLYCMLVNMFVTLNSRFIMYKGFNPPLSNVKNVLNSLMEKYCNFECFSMEQNCILIVFNLLKPDDMNSSEKRLYDIFLDISETLKNYFNITVRIGCSTVKDSFSTLREAYVEAKKALDIAFFITDRAFSIYNADEISYKLPVSIANIKSELYKTLNLDDTDKIKENTQKLFHMFTKLPVSGVDIFNHEMISIVNYIDHFLSEQFGMDINTLTEQCDQSPIQTIIESPNLITTLKYISSIMDLICETIKKEWLNNNIIMEAKKYIDLHYSENIGLMEVSNHLNISSCYLSKQFKKKTGENFSHYISGLRVQKSIELMKKTRYSTDYIAEIIGYPNTNYFIKVFKKVTGKTISDYKKDQY